MVQDKQVKKVKRYRAMKCAFYCMGLPLFFIIVLLSAIRFIGNDPFTGTGDVSAKLGFFMQIDVLLTSPALYGVYIAFGIWVAISVVHIILAATIESRRVRMLAVIAVSLVVMLGGMFAMDAILGAKVEEIANNAPAGVVVRDYKSQLSFYRAVSSNLGANKRLSNSLAAQVQLLENVYNVKMEGIDKSGVAGNTSNKPATYYDVIDDEGNIGVDVSFKTNEQTGRPMLDYDSAGGANNFAADGKISRDVEGRQTIRLAPNASGELVINGKIYSHYFNVQRTAVSGDEVNVWYAKDMMPTSWTLDKKGKSVITRADGVYGEAFYNRSGLLSDGWIFSLDNVLEILADYHEANDALTKGDAYGTAEEYKSYYAEMYTKAAEKRNAYYTGKIPDADGNYVDPWVSALYSQEVYMTEKFSLTRGELDELVSKLGGFIGDNSLFDYLLINIDTFIGDGIGAGQIVDSLVGQSLGSLFKQLNAGMSLTQLLGKFGVNADTMKTVVGIVKQLANMPESEELKDIYITAAYKAHDGFGRAQDHLYVALVKDNGAGGMGKNPETDILLELDFDDRVNPDGSRAIDLDAISSFLTVGLNNLLTKQFGIDLSSGPLNTIVGLVLKDMVIDGETYKGLTLAGIQIPLLKNGKIDINLGKILQNLLKGFYSYQSAVIKPVWEFYESEVNLDEDGNVVKNYRWAAATHYTMRERALYEASTHGSIIGSVLIGDNLGDGKYPAKFGLADLLSVRQLQTDLSYQPLFFPLYALRDMLAFFTGLVLLSYFISFVAAEKEEEYATGKLSAKGNPDADEPKTDESKNGGNGGGTTHCTLPDAEDKHILSAPPPETDVPVEPSLNEEQKEDKNIPSVSPETEVKTEDKAEYGKGKTKKRGMRFGKMENENAEAKTVVTDESKSEVVEKPETEEAKPEVTLQDVGVSAEAQSSIVPEGAATTPETASAPSEPMVAEAIVIKKKKKRPVFEVAEMVTDATVAPALQEVKAEDSAPMASEAKEAQGEEPPRTEGTDAPVDQNSDKEVS